MDVGDRLDCVSLIFVTPFSADLVKQFLLFCLIIKEAYASSTLQESAVKSLAKINDY
jgi:hypothetical protein